MTVTSAPSKHTIHLRLRSYCGILGTGRGGNLAAPVAALAHSRVRTCKRSMLIALDPG
eukprot:CAMPEP_0185554662 /NCGR_PEP_ID=MMETSP1381-20130426/41978_1 /TAXON_ID=298111 /ORGANISM="Pavlova sp., Strain CCMP459" /LENGTH=57 /DNA_ID=CAMNT_0028167889 /DNA_START=93 /DNA_END=262 /DNA_ORIENTATION=-